MGMILVALLNIIMDLLNFKICSYVRKILARNNLVPKKNNHIHKYEKIL